MPRLLSLGNERMLVSFDADYRLRDFFYPHIGTENHLGGSQSRMGIHVDGQFRWLERAAGWSIAIGYEPDTLVGRVEARHDQLGIALTCTELPVRDGFVTSVTSISWNPPVESRSFVDK